MHSYVANWVVEYDLDKFENNCTGSQDITINDGMIQTVEADFYGMKYRFSTPIMSKQCHHDLYVDCCPWFFFKLLSKKANDDVCGIHAERFIFLTQELKNCFPPKIEAISGWSLPWSLCGPICEFHQVYYKIPSHSSLNNGDSYTYSHSSSTFLEAKHFSSCQS